MAAKIEFKKGDGITHYFKIPADAWTAGGKLMFAAKIQPDDDATDALAVIDKTFDDSVVTDETIDSVDYKVYTLRFIDTDTADVTFEDHSKRKTYIGEFQYVPAGETDEPETFPADDNFIQVIVYADIKRKVT